MIVVANSPLKKFSALLRGNGSVNFHTVGLWKEQYVLNDTGIECKTGRVHQRDEVFDCFDSKVVEVVFYFGINVLIGELGIVQKEEVALHIVLFENTVYGMFVATCNLDIVYEETAFSFYEGAVDVVGVVCDEVHTLFIAHIAVVLHIGLIAVNLGSYTRAAVVLKEKVVQFCAKVMAQIV